MTERWAEIRNGWTTLVAAGAGACAGITGLGFYTFGLFVKPLSEAFGWSRGQISLGLTWITVGTFLCAPAVGWLTDRFGVRKVAAPSLLGLGLAYAALSAINASIFSFYLACLAVAVLGCATSPVTWTRAVSVVFIRSRGLALGLTLLGSALAAVAGGPLLQAVISRHGWRSAYLAMAAFTVLIAFPLVLLLLRGTAAAPAGPSAQTTGLDLAEAVRTLPFWIIGLGIMLLITAQSGVIVHLSPLLTDRGLTPVEAAGALGLMGASIFVSRVAVGAMLDRFNPAAVAGLALAAPAAAAAILAMAGAQPALVTVAVILLGLSAGAEIDLLSFFTARFFGLRAYGRIYGMLFAMFIAGNGIGAPLMGLAYDHWGSYGPAMWIAAALFALGAASFASLGLFASHAADR